MKPARFEIESPNCLAYIILACIHSPEQVGFITYITSPLWNAWRSFVAPTEDMIQLRNLRTNLSVTHGIHPYML